MDLSVGAGTQSAIDPGAYALGGVKPGAAVRPTTREELGSVLRAAAAAGGTILPWGGGVALAQGTALRRYDLAIDLTGLDRVIEYEPEDLTLTAECGVTIATLRKLLATRQQELPLEAAHADRATLGGVLASNASGPRRLRFGSPRDRILGARYALTDGTMARSGGKVVKNVAGYGIHRMLCGSEGGLAIVVEASLKLSPAPASRRALIYSLATERVVDPGLWRHFPRLEPAVLSVVGGNAAPSLPVHGGEDVYTIVLGFEDEPAWAERQEAIAIEALGAPLERLEGERAIELWQTLADLEEQPGPRLSFTTAHNTPAALAVIAAHPSTRRATFHAPAGRLHVFPDLSAAPELIQLLAANRFHLIGARGLPELASAMTSAAAVSSLRGRIRAALDPESRMALGSRWVG